MDINSASPDQAWPLPSHSTNHQPCKEGEAGCAPSRSVAEAGRNPAVGVGPTAGASSPLDEPAWFTRYNTRVVGRQVPRLAGVVP